ncbi:MAG TPA: UDP-N-acetylmuramate dehydrogenase [Candidatus Saccharimonadales bacterium]|nr:UDP-N-acetylmuramate dehydrogenase [Candidatus Saccharimonadales bacterium]
MNIRRDVHLRDYSTMRLGGSAAYLIDIHSPQELAEAAQWADNASLPIIMVGGGSNIIWSDGGFSGLVMVDKILGFNEVITGDEHIVTIGAGEQWDHIVARTAKQGLSGIEALSLIPGTAGATPIQNVGAYGQEISSTLVKAEAYDHKIKQFVTLKSADFQFGYRTSQLKTGQRGRYFITSITLRLHSTNPTSPFYPDVQAYFDEHSINKPTPQTLREAVVAIRSKKLPDPAIIANSGSFFANPTIPKQHFAKLAASYPTLPHWQLKDGSIKLPAAWLLEQAGFRGIHDQRTGMATWPSQALVLVNEHASSTAQLLSFRNQIIAKVQALFDITLTQEPELLP